MAPVDATIVITSKNRSQDLQRALRSAVAQDGRPEIIVIDDGSEDDTPTIVAAFPSVITRRYETSRGLIARRNEAAGLASRSVIISIDDDAEFSATDTCLRVVDAFGDPRLGAVAIPCIEPFKENTLFQVPPDTSSIYVTDSFMGTAYAVRRGTFVSLGGFRETLVRQGEERDFAIRLLSRGLFVGYAEAPHIIHYESAVRNWELQGFYGRRNDIMFPIHNAPLAAIIPHLIVTLWNGVRVALRGRHANAMYRGLVAGWLAIPSGFRERTPASWRAYMLSRELRKKGPMQIDHAVAKLSGQTTRPQGS